jgi:hypothetical protein
LPIVRNTNRRQDRGLIASVSIGFKAETADYADCADVLIRPWWPIDTIGASASVVIAGGERSADQRRSKTADRGRSLSPGVCAHALPHLRKLRNLRLLLKNVAIRRSTTEIRIERSLSANRLERPART